MALRPIKPEEKALIEHLLQHIPNGKRYAIPDEVENMGEYGVLLSKKGEHSLDLIEAEYIDEDRRSVLITLTANQHGELFELDIWKTDFNPLRRYPTPDKIEISE
jgi:hypothetical protein